MDAITDGDSNVAIGAEALGANLAGHDNTAVGHSAMATNTTGQRNVAIGHDALLSNVTSNDNTALGMGSLYYNTAANNTAVERMLYTQILQVLETWLSVLTLTRPQIQRTIILLLVMVLYS